MLKEKLTVYKRIALALTLCALILWGILGAGTSLAWFVGTSDDVNNIFHFADFEVVVSHRLTDGTWDEIDGNTKIFDEQALYEPGYVQVVYLKVENRGDVDFEFYTATNVNGCILATNVFGQQFSLQDYLKFGITINDTEEKMKNSVADRDVAVTVADMPLHNYDTETVVVKPNKAAYIALVVRMPEEVGNIANYRGDTVPEVDLGITVKADQKRN